MWQYFVLLLISTVFCSSIPESKPDGPGSVDELNRNSHSTQHRWKRANFLSFIVKIGSKIGTGVSKIGKGVSKIGRGLGEVKIPSILEKTLDSSGSVSENQEKASKELQAVSEKNKTDVLKRVVSTKPISSAKLLSRAVTRSRTKSTEEKLCNKDNPILPTSEENDQNWEDINEDNHLEEHQLPAQRKSTSSKTPNQQNENGLKTPQNKGQTPIKTPGISKTGYDSDDEAQQLAKILSSQEDEKSGTDDDDDFDSDNSKNGKNVKFAKTGPVFMSPKTRYSTSDSSDDENDVPVNGHAIPETDGEKREILDEKHLEKKFTIFLSPEEYKSFVIWLPNTSGKDSSHYATVPKAHGPILRAHFDQVNKSCNVIFSKKHIVDPNGISKPFWVCYGLCKREICTARWKFTIQRAPFSHVEHVPVTVEFHDGKIKHARGEKSYVRKAGKDLIESKETVRHSKPSAAFAKKFAAADMVSVLRGKYNSVGTIKSLSRLRDKVRAEDDLHPETIFDLALTVKKLREDFPDKLIPGYLQSLGVSPFRVTLFTKRQFRILHSMQKHGYGKSLMIDATSGLVNNIGEPFDDGKVLVYTIIARSPLKGTMPLPIAELLSSDGTALSLYHFLNTVFTKYNIIFNIKDRASNLVKFECDFSKPLLISIVKQFTGLKLDQYLNAYWAYFNSEENNKGPLDLFLVHVCRFHILKTLKRNFKKMFPDKAQFRILSTWAELLVRTKTMRHWDQRIKDIAMLFTYDYETEEITKIVDYLSGNGNSPNASQWSRFSTNHSDPQGPFYQRSYFGLYGDHVFKTCEEQNLRIVTTKKLSKKNLFRSKDAAQYIRHNISPYGPVISRMCYEATENELVDDTTNPIEGYHSGLKNNLYDNVTNMKPSRFINKQAEYIKGLCNRTEADLEIKLGNKKTFDNSTNKPPKTADTTKGPRKKNNSIRNIKQMFRSSTPNISPDVLTKQLEKKTVTNLKSPKKNVAPISLDKSKATPGTWSGSSVVNQDLSQKYIESSDDNVDDNSKTRPTKAKKTAKYTSNLSPEKEVEGFKSTPTQKSDSACKTFMSTIPNVPWGGIHTPTNIRLTNTCSLDTSLTILTALCLSDGSVPNFIARSAAGLNVKAASNPDKIQAKTLYETGSQINCMLDVVDMIEAGEYNDAKSRWINDIQKLDVHQINGNLVNSEAESAFKYIAELFPLTVSLRCVDFDSGDGIKHRKMEYNGNILNVAKPTPHAVLSAINYGYTHDAYCTCGELLRTSYKFKFSQSPFLFYSMIHNRTQMYGEDVLPITQQIRGETYKVFAYTIRSGALDSDEDTGIAHYMAKFPLKGKLLVYDGMCQPYIQRKHNSEHFVTSVWLKKSE